MINLKNFINSTYATKPGDSELLFKEILKKNEYIIDLKGVEIVSTAFFNKLFFLLTNVEKLTTDEILEKLRLKNAEEIHKYAFSAAVDISYNNEKK